MFTAERLSKFEGPAFSAAFNDVMAAAEVLMPYNEPDPSMSRAAHIQATRFEEYDNYILYHELKTRLAVRTGGFNNGIAVELAAQQFKTRHPYVFDHLHEMEDEPRAKREDEIVHAVLHARFRSRIARGAAELLEPGRVPMSTKHRLSYLRDQFENLASQASRAHELNDMFHLYPLAAMAKTATPYDPRAKRM